MQTNNDNITYIRLPWLHVAAMLILWLASFLYGFSPLATFCFIVLILGLYLSGTGALYRPVRHGRVALGLLTSVVGIVLCLCQSVVKVSKGEALVVTHRHAEHFTLQGLRVEWSKSIVEVRNQPGWTMVAPWHNAARIPLLQRYPTALTLSIPVKGGGERLVSAGIWCSVADPAKAAALLTRSGLIAPLRDRIHEIAATMAQSAIGAPFRPEQEEGAMRMMVTSVLQTELRRYGISVDAAALAIAESPAAAKVAMR